MKHLFTLLLLTITGIVTAGNLDSLRLQLRNAQNDSLRAPIHAQMAAEYMGFDTISNRVKKMVYQNEAILNSYQALQLYSKYSDTTGMRTCFDYLAKIYQKQQRYSQAKWFTLQSNNLSRIKSDVPNIILSLKQLASIKNALKEYKMAEQDLTEADYIAKNGYTYIPDSVIQANKAKKLAKKKTQVATVKKAKKTSNKPVNVLAKFPATEAQNKNKTTKAVPAKKLALL
ncbi:MAG: hypothetical protein EOP46_11345 [Sphingobacteriaceae bacterium]|nr:MAG: hypothetical protein EOP46_11345 [Sphingobacteriaceae bacterium]